MQQDVCSDLDCPELLKRKRRVLSPSRLADLHRDSEPVRRAPTISDDFMRLRPREFFGGAEAFSLFCEHLWVGIDSYRRRSTFKAWADTVAWHAALRVVQDPERKRQRPLATNQAEKLAEEVRSRTAPHLLTANKDRLAELRRALDPAEQTLLILRLDRGLSWSEIGEVLAAEGDETSEAALRKRFERVKERLRDLAIARGLLPGGDKQA
jgi:RNA polymerase sigma-70 factor (ECF subfamily)